MDHVAEQHCAKAKKYIAKGNEFHRKAKVEIEKARAAGASVQDISRYLEMSPASVYNLLAWSGEGRLYEQDTARRQVDQAKQVLRESSPQRLALIMDADPEIRRNVAQALVHTAPRPFAVEVSPFIHRGPSFIDLVARANGALIELEALVRGWEDAAAIPDEFQAASFDDVAAKAMRIKDTVLALRGASNDEFQEIVRNFRVVTDVDR